MRTQAEQAIAHSRQVARHPWADWEIADSLYDESDNAAMTTEEKTPDSDDPITVVTYRDGSRAWVTWDEKGAMHFHARGARI
jgi:hypothetical protein